MKKQLENALTQLLTKHQDSDTVTETVRRLTGHEVRIDHGELYLFDASTETWIPTFKIQVHLDPK